MAAMASLLLPFNTLAQQILSKDFELAKRFFPLIRTDALA